MSRKLIRILATLSLAVAPALFNAAWAAPYTYSNVFVFGDSLSDSGNNAIVIDAVAGGLRTPVPLANLDVSPFPYASNRYSNGPVWAEYFAESLGLSATPALAGGANYAFGGAQTGPGGSVFPFSLTDQTGFFLLESGGVAPRDGLYVVEGGGNDARDFLPALFQGTDPAAMIAAYANNIVSIIGRLFLAGADQFLLWNVTDMGKIPMVRAEMDADSSALASELSRSMNRALEQALARLPADIVDGIHLFDSYTGLNSIDDNPAAFGFDNASDACALDPVCVADPSRYFFWDGMHPTTAGHAAIAQLALLALASDVAEPETGLLLALGLFGLVVARRRRH